MTQKKKAYRIFALEILVLTCQVALMRDEAHRSTMSNAASVMRLGAFEARFIANRQVCNIHKMCKNHHLCSGRRHACGIGEPCRRPATAETCLKLCFTCV